MSRASGRSTRRASGGDRSRLPRDHGSRGRFRGRQRGRARLRHPSPRRLPPRQRRRHGPAHRRGPRSRYAPPSRAGCSQRLRRGDRRRRDGLGLRRGRGRVRRRCGLRRQELKWIAVRVPAAGLAHAEVQVRRLGRADARRPNHAQALPGRNALARAHVSRPQVQVGGVEAVICAHAHGQAARTGDTGKADLARSRGDHGRADRSGDVDPPVLSCGVRVVAVAVARDQLALQRPGPRRQRRRDGRCWARCARSPTRKSSYACPTARSPAWSRLRSTAVTGTCTRVWARPSPSCNGL